MEGTKTRAASSLGMFDMLKGLGMAAIIFSHTLELYPMNTEGGISLPILVCFIYSDMLMSAFFIISGYGFRQRPVAKCIHQQRKAMLRPYVYTALATAAVHLLFHYTMFQHWSSAVTETLRVLGGFVLGLPHTATYGGVMIFSCGPMWYMVALVFGWIFLDIVLNLCPERYTNIAVPLVMLAGWACCMLWELPFCLAQGLIVTFYIYIGYLAKRNKLFERPLPWWYSAALVLSCVLIASGALLCQFTDNLSMGRWTLGPISILLNGLIGFGMTRAFTRLDFGQNLLVRFLEKVGRCSLLVFCIHTVELIAVPWYLFAAHFADRPLLGLALQFALRCGIIAAGCALLQYGGSLLHGIRRTLAPKPRKQRSAPQH